MNITSNINTTLLADIGELTAACCLPIALVIALIDGSKIDATSDLM